jgi:hypothetical protein
MLSDYRLHVCFILHLPWKIGAGLVEQKLCSCQKNVDVMVDLAGHQNHKFSSSNFEAASVQLWVAADKDTLLLLTFKEFMSEFKMKFLARSWEDELVQDQITFQGNTPFLTLINKVHNGNDKLNVASSASYIFPTQFHQHLIARLNPALKRMYNRNNTITPGWTVGILDAIVDLGDWMEHIQNLEEDLNMQRLQWIENITKKAQTITAMPAPAPVGPFMNMTNNAVPPPLSLTDGKKTLITAHHGCYKCHVFYAGHMS